MLSGEQIMNKTMLRKYARLIAAVGASRLQLRVGVRPEIELLRFE